ncbi:hypothetical protein SELMODRAFT_72295, partial [Selaginella moellendorffii]
ASVLWAYAQCGDLERCKRVFDGMAERNLVAWTIMLELYAQHGRARESMWLFERMPEHDLNPDATCFVALLASHCHAGKLRAGIHCFLSMRSDHGLEPYKQHYSCLIGLFTRSGHLNDAGALLASMPFVPDALDWRCFLGACRFFDRGAEHGTLAAAKILELEPQDSSLY